MLRPDLCPIVSPLAYGDAAPMAKRVTSGLLWFFVGLYGWAFVVAVTGITPLLGPVLAACLAAFFAGDPLHVIWTHRPSTDRVNSRLDLIPTEAWQALNDPR